MKRNRVYLVSVLLSCFLLSGCFGSTDINDLALVMAVGLDKGDQPGSVKVTAQVARPGDVVGQTGAPSAGTGEPIWTATATGMSIFDAIRNLAKYSSRRVYWAHNKVIVISEDLARETGINDIVDFFARNHELRMRTWVVVTPNQASELVATKTGLEVVPGSSIEKLFRYTSIASAAPQVDMRTVEANYLSAGTEVVLPIVQIRQRGISAKDANEFGSLPQVELAGTAYFNKTKLKGTLNEDESQALMWFVDDPNSLVLVLHCPDDSTGKVSLEMKNHHFSVEPVYQKGRPEFNIHLTANFDMVELGCPWQRSQNAIIKLLEQQAKQKLTSDIANVIHVAQSNKTDFLGLGERFEDRYPAEWQKLKPIWSNTLSSAKVNVSVMVHIHSPVLLQTPTAPGGNTYP